MGGVLSTLRSDSQSNPMTKGILMSHDPRIVRAQQVRRVRARLDRIAYWLDECFTIPGTGWKIGLEPIIGLVPVAGDLVGLLLSGYIILEGIRVGAPPRLTARMAGIALVDVLSGLIPVVGDVFDFAFKANRRNAQLLSRYLDNLEGRDQSQSRTITMAMFALSAGAIALIVWTIFLFYHFLA